MDPCNHLHIDNDTWQCRECGERMIAQKWDADTVQDAPNLAACDNPACREALNDGTYDETNPPAGCANPRGVYVPGPARTVTIGYRVTYDCDRCANPDGITYTPESTTYGCGREHEGGYVDR